MESFEFGVELGLGGFLEVPISPKLFLTAGHCVLSEAGEYVFGADGEEEYKRTKPLVAKTKEELMRMSKKEMAAFMAQQTFEYNPNVEMEDVGGESVQETNQSLNVSFYDEDGEKKVSVGGKVLCAVYNDDYSLDFALIELEEPVDDIETPELSTQTDLSRGFIFHYPQGGERTLSVAQIMRPVSTSHEFKLTYRADTKDQSSGSSVLSESGKIIGVHTDRDLLAEEIAALATDDEAEDLEAIEKQFSETDGKFVHGVPIVEILNFRSKATEMFINALASNGVKIDGRVPRPVSYASQTAASQLVQQQQQSASFN